MFLILCILSTHWPHPYPWLMTQPVTWSPPRVRFKHKQIISLRPHDSILKKSAIPIFTHVPLKLSLKISNPWSTREADLSNNKPPSSCLADLESLKSSFAANHHLDKLVLFVQEARRTCLGIIRVDGGVVYPCSMVLSTEQPHKGKSLGWGYSGSSFF